MVNRILPSQQQRPPVGACSLRRWSCAQWWKWDVEMTPKPEEKESKETIWNLLEEEKTSTWRMQSLLKQVLHVPWHPRPRETAGGLKLHRQKLRRQIRGRRRGRKKTLVGEIQLLYNFASWRWKQWATTTNRRRSGTWSSQGTEGWNWSWWRWVIWGVASLVLRRGSWLRWY